MKKRILSLILSAAMIMSMTGTIVFAETATPRGASSIGPGTSSLVPGVSFVMESVEWLGGNDATFTLVRTAGTQYQLQLGDGVSTAISGPNGSAIKPIDDLFIPNNFKGDNKTYYILQIGDNAFNGVTELTGALTGGNSIQKIGKFAFANTGLTSVTNSATSEIDKNAFSGCSALTTAELQKVSTLNENTFQGCTSLETVKLSSSMLAIDKNAFAGCTALTDVKLSANSKLNTIRGGAFSDCTSLTTIKLPSHFETLEAGAFNGTSLENIYFSSEVAPTITGNDFDKVMVYYINGALGFTDENGFSKTTPMDPENIQLKCGEEMMHFEVKQLASASQPGTVWVGDGTNSCINSGYSFENWTLPSEVTFSGSTYTVVAIAPKAFEFCNNLESITFPPSVTEIGNFAFAYCNFSEIVIPKTITKIGDDAFASSSILAVNMESTTAPELGKDVFRNNNELTIKVPAGATGYGDGGWQKYKDQIVPATGTRADTTALNAAINAAKTFKDSIHNSDNNGTDIPNTKQWASSAVHTAFGTAIDTATKVCNDPAIVDQGLIDAQTDALTAAQTAFTAKLQWGTQEGGNPGEVNKAALNAAIAAAKTSNTVVETSETGTDIPTTKKWATKAAHDLLSSAIDAAQLVADNTSATQTEVYSMTATLTTAKEAFERSVKNGTKEDTGPNPKPDPTPTESGRPSQYYDWMVAERRIATAKSGDIVKMHVDRDGTMPRSVMQALGLQSGVTLVINRTGGTDITITSATAHKPEPYRVYYPMATLDTLYPAKAK